MPALAEEVDGDTEDARDPQQRVECGVRLPRLDLLVEAPSQRDPQEHGLLREVAVYAFVSDSSADTSALSQ